MQIIRTVIVLIFMVMPFVVVSQNKGNHEDDHGGHSDATADSIKTRIITWKLTDEFSTREEAIIDTQTINFHIYDPVYKASISNTTLGYAGSPYQSNIFTDRNSSAFSKNFFFSRNIKAYMPAASELTFHNTTRSFSVLKYVQEFMNMGGTEQVFDAFVIRNIDYATNFGGRFHVDKPISEYNYQQAHHRHLDFFISRNTEHYNGYFSLVKGSSTLKDNGGISDDVINTALDPSEIDINLIRSQGLDNVTKSFSLFTSHEYIIGKDEEIINKTDSTIEQRFKPLISAQYSIEWENDRRDITESVVDTNFYDNTYISLSNKHTDSTTYKRFAQTLQLKAFESIDRKFTFGKRVFAQNEIITATHPVSISGIRKYQYSNLNVGASIYRLNGDFWKWNVTGQVVLLGRNIGDAQLKGKIEKPFRFKNDSIVVTAEAWYRDQSEDVFQRHYLSNHYYWNNDFKKQHDVVIKGQISYPTVRLKLGANYTLLSNYLYNNQQGIPDQYNDEFSVLGAWIKKDFKLGHFWWCNQVVWQYVSDEKVLRLPSVSAYTSLYYSHFLFKVMQIQLGADCYYNTAFYADNYNPATTQFYLQDNVKTGNYPVINLFFNAKLKRASGFIKMQHANSMFNGNQFFSAPGYPIGQMVVRYGFTWTFYD